ncbi:hypothetical protein [Furfurilactobacillus entadae]|uniref:hypothetical protein n=1 Tax=Furfurilactobacillus entadae TaxID=2922307 RepID=UPI0035EA415C
MRQGNWLTVVLWIVGIALHLLSDRAWQGSDATLMLYLGLTLLIQRGLVWLRARRQFPEATQQTAAYHEAHHRERHHSRQR